MFGRKLKDKYTLLTTDHGRIPEWGIIFVVCMYMLVGTVFSFIIECIIRTMIPQIDWFIISIIILVIFTVAGIHRVTESNVEVK